MAGGLSSIKNQKNDRITEDLDSLDKNYEDIFGSALGSSREFESNGNTINYRSIEIAKDTGETVISEDTKDVKLSSFDHKNFSLRGELLGTRLRLLVRGLTQEMRDEAIGQNMSLTWLAYEQELMYGLIAKASATPKDGEATRLAAATYTTAKEYYQALADGAKQVSGSLNGKRRLTNIWVSEDKETILKENISDANSMTWLEKLESLSYVGGVEIIPTVMYETIFGDIDPNEVIFANPEAVLIANCGIPLMVKKAQNEDQGLSTEAEIYEFTRGRVVANAKQMNAILVQHVSESVVPLSKGSVDSQKSDSPKAPEEKGQLEEIEELFSVLNLAIETENDWAKKQELETLKTEAQAETDAIVKALNEVKTLQGNAAKKAKADVKEKVASLIEKLKGVK